MRTFDSISIAKHLGVALLVLGLMGCSAVAREGPSPTATDPAPPEPSPTAVQLSQAADPATETETRSATVETGTLSYQSVTLTDGTVLEYALVLPPDYSSDGIYPVLLALPPGGQTQEMVQAGLGNYWAQEAQERGWIVVSPVAPEGLLFYQGGELLVPEFLEHITSTIRPEGGKFHLAGISNGGISAFRIAVDHPELFHSVIVLPGFPRGEDAQRLENLKDIPVAMFVGEQDTSWHRSMEGAEETLSELGGRVSLEVIEGEGHVIRSLAGGERLFDLLDSFRPRE